MIRLPSVVEFASDALGEVGTAVIEHVLERLQPHRQHLAHRIATISDHVGEQFGALAELIGHPIAALDDGVGDASAGLLQLGDHVAAAQTEVEHQRIAAVLERGVHFLDAAGDGVGEPVAGLDHEVGHLLRAIAHQVEDGRGLLREALGHPVETHRHHVLEVGRDLGELVADVVGLEIQGRGQAVAGGRDRFRGVLAGAFEAVEQVAAALAQGLDHGVAGVPERARDVLALFRERVGDPARRLVDLLGHELADLGNVVAEIEVHAVDRIADLPRLAHQGVALAAEILEQRADAHLVVVVGMLEGGDLVRHQRLQLGSARERALDAVSHGGDLASDRLPHGDDRFARHRLRLGQPHGDLGHGLRDEPQFLRAPRHVGEHEEEDDRREEDREQHAEHRRGQSAGAEGGLQLRKIHPAEPEAAEHPHHRKDGRDDVGRACGAALEGAQDLTDGFAIVVGRPAQRALVLGASDLLVVEEVETGGRGGAHAAPRRLRGRLLHGPAFRRMRGRVDCRGGWRCSRAFRLGRAFPHRKRILDRRQRRFRRILHLLRGVRHVGRRLALRWTTAHGRNDS